MPLPVRQGQISEQMPYVALLIYCGIDYSQRVPVLNLAEMECGRLQL